MDYVKIRTHVADHSRFLAAGHQARDLWLWGMLWSGEHETDGAIPMHAVLSSPWGASGKANVRVAKKLEDVGLWERTTDGYRILRWSEQGNLTAAELEDYRRVEREKKRASRARPKSIPPPGTPPGSPSGCPPGTPQGTPEGVLNSTSYSSGSGASSETRSEPPVRSDQPPAWWDEACETAAMSAGIVGDRAGRWLEYRAARQRKGWPMGRDDAAGWLSNVVRSERTRGPVSGPRAVDGPPKQTPEQARAFGRELAARINAAAAEGDP